MQLNPQWAISYLVYLYLYSSLLSAHKKGDCNLHILRQFVFCNCLSIHRISSQHDNGQEHFDINATNLKALGFIDDCINSSTTSANNYHKKKKRSMSQIFNRLKSRQQHQGEDFFIDFCKRNHSVHLNQLINKTKKKSKSTKIADIDEHIKPDTSSLPTNIDSNANIPDIKLLDPRRVVFVSLLGLYRTYMNTPTFILYSCLIILPLKRSWLYENENNSENKCEGPKDAQNAAAHLLDKCMCFTLSIYEILRRNTWRDNLEIL